MLVSSFLIRGSKKERKECTLDSGITVPIQRWIEKRTNSRKKLEIVLISYGTRGDIQPLIALGAAMMHDDIHVVMCAPDCFQPLVLKHGLEFASIGVARVEQPIEVFTASGFSGVLPALTIIYKDLAEGIIKTSKKADMIVCGALVRSIVLHVCEKQRIPSFCVHLAPTDVCTSEFPPLEFMDHPLSLYLHANRLLYTWRQFSIVFAAIRCGLAAADVAVRMNLLNMSKGDPFVTAKDVEEQPSLHAYSEALQRKPKDWPSNVRISGFWTLSMSSEKLPLPVDVFLNHDASTVLVTFGSMRNVESLLELTARAILKLGIRGIVQSSSPLIVPKNESLLIWEHSLPHDIVMMRCNGIVHHGGAGTTCASLCAGKPSVVIPILPWADQRYWAQRIDTHECGIHLPKSDCNEETMVSAITAILSDQNAFKMNATAMSHLLAKEKGSVIEAASIIVEYTKKLNT